MIIYDYYNGFPPALGVFRWFWEQFVDVCSILFYVILYVVYIYSLYIGHWYWFVWRAVYCILLYIR
jgi:hypothetical protein